VGEEELRGTLAAGRPHLAAWNYFMSIKSPANTEFIKVVGPAKAKKLPALTSRPTTRWKRPTSASTCGSRRLKSQVHRHRQGDCRHVGQTFAPSASSKMDEKPPPAQVGVHREIKADGQFNVVWKTPGPEGQPGARTSRQRQAVTSRSRA
jgi:urea transport system substrate-binding protein